MWYFQYTESILLTEFDVKLKCNQGRATDFVVPSILTSRRTQNCRVNPGKKNAKASSKG